MKLNGARSKRSPDEMQCNPGRFRIHAHCSPDSAKPVLSTSKDFIQATG